MREIEGRKPINSPVRESESMSKAVLVMDMPEICRYCDFCDNNIHLEKVCHAKVEYSEECGIYYREIENDAVKPDWCPLHPMPEEREENHTGIYEDNFNEGWNACIDAIGGNDNET